MVQLKSLDKLVMGELKSLDKLVMGEFSRQLTLLCDVMVIQVALSRLKKSEKG